MGTQTSEVPCIIPWMQRLGLEPRFLNSQACLSSPFLNNNRFTFGLVSIDAVVVYGTFLTFQSTFRDSCKEGRKMLLLVKDEKESSEIY